jgi:hypothetical protein
MNPEPISRPQPMYEQMLDQMRANCPPDSDEVRYAELTAHLTKAYIQSHECHCPLHFGIAKGIIEAVAKDPEVAAAVIQCLAAMAMKSDKFMEQAMAQYEVIDPKLREQVASAVNDMKIEGP